MDTWKAVLDDLESTVHQWTAEADRLGRALEQWDSEANSDGFDATWRTTLDRLGDRVRQLGDIAEQAAHAAETADAPISAAEDTTRRWLNQVLAIQARLQRFAPSRV